MASSKNKRRRTKRVPSQAYPKYIWFGLFFLGIQLLCLVGWHLLYKTTVLSFKVAPVITYTSTVRAEEPVSVIIQSAQIKAPIVPAQIRDGIWETSDSTATHLSSSARPGENGNVVVYAHNRKHLFANLSQVKLQDEITITTAANKQYTYKVTAISEVKPDAIEAVLPTDHEVLTVYTCSGWMDQRRLVVKAVPLSVQSISVYAADEVGLKLAN